MSAGKTKGLQTKMILEYTDISAAQNLIDAEREQGRLSDEDWKLLQETIILVNENARIIDPGEIDTVSNKALLYNGVGFTPITVSVEPKRNSIVIYPIKALAK